MTNAQIADRLEAFATLLELADANPYQQRAYARAAAAVRDAPASVADLVRDGRVRRLRGVGPGIEARLKELVTTGRIAELEELERELTPELIGLGRFLGLTAERVIGLARALEIRTAEELREAAASGRLRDAPGVGAKTEAKLLEALSRADAPRPRRSLLVNQARELVGSIAAALDGETAGDARRWRDRCEHLAVVCSATEPQPVIAAFAGLGAIVTVLEEREDGAVGLTVEGVPVELTVAPPERLGTALVRATGSEAYVAGLGPLPDAPDEAAVFAALGLPWVPPELREAPALPVPEGLLSPGDIRGDLHMHTTWSDGRASVEEMGRAAIERGYDYIAICDHTPAVGAVQGLTPDDVRRQGEEIAAANVALAPFRVLRGIECDILPDGRLDLPDDVLAELDWVQASVHGGQRMPAREMTKRVEAALRNPYVSCLSHPTGRYINRRPENALDLDHAFAVALEEGVAMEVNGLPLRLDLRGELVRDALAAGLRIVCSTDAHSPIGLGNLPYAVATARRGGATAADVVNTWPLEDVLGAPCPVACRPCTTWSSSGRASRASAPPSSSSARASPTSSSSTTTTASAARGAGTRIPASRWTSRPSATSSPTPSGRTGRGSTHPAPSCAPTRRTARASTGCRRRRASACGSPAPSTTRPRTPGR